MLVLPDSDLDANVATQALDFDKPSTLTGKQNRTILNFS